MADGDEPGGVAAPPARDIGDLASFEEFTRGDDAVAGLYCYMHLDVLIELARRIALDFFARPVIYRDERIGDVARELAQLHARYGCDEYHLAAPQRQSVFVSMFGHGEAFANGAGTAEQDPVMNVEGATPAGEHFEAERDQLLAAVAAFAERVFDTGERPLRDAVAVMAPGLRSWLRDLNHVMVQWVRNEALASLTEGTSYRILRNPGIAAAFGMSAPSEAWPYREEADGTALVAEVSNRLWHPGAVTRDAFIDRQRLALRGAEAIATVLDFPDGVDVGDEAADRLISKCYTWYAARGRALGVPLATVAVAPSRVELGLGVVNGAPGNRGLFVASPSVGA
jgi:hypothetical protein